MTTLPVIDLSLPEEEVAARVRAACLAHGFFYVVNHGIADAVRASFFEQCKAFWALPAEQKLSIVADSNFRGYTPFNEERLDPSKQKTGDTKEGLYFGRHVSPDDPEAAKPLHGPNQWPDPTTLPDFRPAVQAYFDACTDLGYRLLDVFAVSLSVPKDFLRSKFKTPSLFLRPLHYSSERSDPENGLFGAGAHSDYGLLTILATDGTPGLQILQDGVWRNVEPLGAGELTINLGDMLERWTNGLYKSTVHRVLSQSGQDRYSAPFFFEPDFDAEIACLPGCEGDGPRYPSCTAGQHLMDKYRSTHDMFAEKCVTEAPAG